MQSYKMFVRFDFFFVFSFRLKIFSSFYVTKFPRFDRSSNSRSRKKSHTRSKGEKNRIWIRCIFAKSSRFPFIFLRQPSSSIFFSVSKEIFRLVQANITASLSSFCLVAGCCCYCSWLSSSSLLLLPLN